MGERDLSKQIAAARVLKASLEGFDDETLRDTIEGETGLHESIARVMAVILEDEIMIAGVSEIAKTLDSRKARLERRVERLRDAIAEAMQVGEIKTLHLPDATLSLREVAPKVIVQDETKIPAEYFDTRATLNKTRLNEAVRAGRMPEGVAMSNKSTSLSIRRA